MADRIPVHVLTGFLGAGKTTLLNALLAHPGMADTAVVINEFGEIGLDHLIVETAFEDAVLLQSGCVCCSIRGDLVDTLALLLARRDSGDLPPFARVVIETTGLADPAPVMQTLMAEPTVTARFALGGVITVVDAAHALAEIERRPEPARQIAAADRIVLAKTDIAPEGERPSLERRLRALNPNAPLHEAVSGAIAPSALLRAPPGGGSDAADLAAWLGKSPDEHGVDHGHGSDIRTFCIARDRPIAWRALKRWLDSVLSIRGVDVLRVKGIADVDGVANPVMIHAVHHLVHPPVRLDAWPDGARRTRVVFICQGGIGRNEVEAVLRASIAAMT